MSLANVVAVARATDSLVLLGDPQQLDQPMQGTHPPGADRSALGHVLGDHATMPPDRGLFLETTWRLHPDLCSFTSEAFYESRLEAEPHLVVQRLDVEDRCSTSGVGPRLLGVPTIGADNESPEEAAAVAQVARSIVEGGSTWINEKGERQPVTWDEVLIVAPYNAQVGAIMRLLPAEARVGTVDKFQGQEAPISIYSLTTSSPELAPRGMDFLYSRNRLNVATSRARCITIVAASPDLLRVRARTPAQMRLANALCLYVERCAAGAAQPARRRPDSASCRIARDPVAIGADPHDARALSRSPGCYPRCNRNEECRVPEGTVTTQRLAVDSPGMLAWRTFLTAHATIIRALEAELEAEEGLALSDFDVLAQLNVAGGTLRMRDLADRVLLSRSGLTRRVDRLEIAGLRRANRLRDGSPRLVRSPDRRRSGAALSTRCRCTSAASPTTSSPRSTPPSSPRSAPPSQRSSRRIAGRDERGRPGRRGRVRAGPRLPRSIASASAAGRSASSPRASRSARPATSPRSRSRRSSRASSPGPRR